MHMDDKMFFVLSLIANCKSMSLSNECISPGIINECRGSPRSIWVISCKVALTILWASDPTRDNPTQTVSSVNAEKWQFMYISFKSFFKPLLFKFASCSLGKVLQNFQCFYLIFWDYSLPSELSPSCRLFSTISSNCSEACFTVINLGGSNIFLPLNRTNILSSYIWFKR